MVGLLRGTSSALLAALRSTEPAFAKPAFVEEAQDIVTRLGELRFVDIAPPDLEAEAHAREHLETFGQPDEEMDIVDGEIKEKRDVEGLEDMLAVLSTGNSKEPISRVTMADLEVVKERLLTLSTMMGIEINLS
jgi:hypothetical protein